MLARARVESREFTGNTTFAEDPQRPYLFIVMTGADGTVEFGSGGGDIPLPTTTFFEPYVVPTSEFTVTTTGTFIVMSSASTLNNTV